MNFNGVLLGVFLFLIIGLFHPIVIKCEYYFGVKCWWCFLVAGVVALTISLLIEGIFWSTVAGVLAFTCFWSIKEVFDQRERVRKGWFPKNPKRKD
ncbi:MAG: DUF4491 family protein [Bacteroidales bacterium]|nr:DUF4491 family protein [Bacteroidales bacterium]